MSGGRQRRPRRPIARPRRRSRPGATPGTLIADPQAAAPTISCTSYGPAGCETVVDCPAGQIAALRERAPMLWVDVTGLGDVGLVQQIGEAFDLHRLALEDVVNVHQRPKVEPFGDHVFIVARMLVADRGGDSEQVAMFLGRDYLLTFQERPGDCFGPVRERLHAVHGRMRQAGPDYLAYALIDAIIDGYYPVLERYGEAIEALEDEVIAQPHPAQIDRLHGLKRDLLAMRRAVWPMREMVNVLIRDESPLIAAETRLFLRDCYDHAIQLMDIVETYREIASGLLDVYLSSISARMNEVMKVLTVIATIFIPLSFVASLYGMNFDPDASPWNMPELGWRYGYPMALAIMAAVAGGLLTFFWRRGWIGRRRRPGPR